MHVGERPTWLNTGDFSYEKYFQDFLQAFFFRIFLKEFFLSKIRISHQRTNARTIKCVQRAICCIRYTRKLLFGEKIFVARQSLRVESGRAFTHMHRFAYVRGDQSKRTTIKKMHRKIVNDGRSLQGRHCGSM